MDSRFGLRSVLNFAIVLFVLALAAVGCARPGLVEPASAPGTGDTEASLDITVSIVPQKYFVERIGGEYVAVNVMVLPGNNPATYEPKPEQLKALSSADAYVSIGVPFETVWLPKIAAANERMVIVDSIAEIERMPMSAHEHGEDRADEEDEHAEGAPDPHVWLSPSLVKVQSQAIYRALIELDPAHEDAYRANLDAFVADIDALEADIRDTLGDLENNKFMVFHPSWGYLARDFGLEQIAIEVGGQEPSAAELARLIQQAKQEEIRVIFAQPEFSTRDAETIAQEIDGQVLLVSPLAADWLANLRQVAESFARVLGQ